MTGTVLVLRALGLGDLLTGVPALRGLRRAFPDAEIVLAAPERFGELAMLIGAVDTVWPTAGLGRLRPPDAPPKLAVNLHGSGPESIADLLAVQPETLLTHRHDAYPAVPGPPWRADVHEVDRWCALLGSADIACDPEDLRIVPSTGTDRPGVVVIHPGAASQARRWPADRFAAVAVALREAGHDVVVTGSAEEAALAQSVAGQAGLPDTAVLAGRLGLIELVALVAECALLICGDTGIAHIATATGAPSIVLFGPTPPSRWGPRLPGPHTVLWNGQSGDPHAGEPHPGLLCIGVADVLDAVDSLHREPV
ncbi:glycosyltransferase family 9 protein [Mycolicibacterium sp. S2-37]|uniref:glycosyltransferase family 9 protein n=1 Tax=Mycolicibacterium sp. S2-37 TaxID=2810297 RepID=UPI0027D9EA72|nr:glycosyltransferase family 9 protein [Mycolicibacterium sp. S2-37]